MYISVLKSVNHATILENSATFILTGIRNFTIGEPISPCTH